jgi:hypothetical protein
MGRGLLLVAAGTLVVGANGSAAASQPTVAQIQAAVAGDSDSFILANSFGFGGKPPGDGWIDLETGAGRWVSANGKTVSIETVTPEPHDPALVTVKETTIDYTARQWYQTSRVEPAKMARPRIVDPLAASVKKFRLLGVQKVDGREAYHLRSTYTFQDDERVDVWYSTDQPYLIRWTRTTKQGTVGERVDNRWLQRTRANLALTTATIPSGFKQVFVSP